MNTRVNVTAPNHSRVFEKSNCPQCNRGCGEDLSVFSFSPSHNRSHGAVTAKAICFFHSPQLSTWHRQENGPGVVDVVLILSFPGTFSSNQQPMAGRSQHKPTKSLYPKKLQIQPEWVDPTLHKRFLHFLDLQLAAPTRLLNINQHIHQLLDFRLASPTRPINVTKMILHQRQDPRGTLSTSTSKVSLCS